MTGVVLTTVWFAAEANLADAVSVPYVTQNNRSPQTKGETREYGGGRFRAVLTSATQRTYPLAFAACDPTLVAWIKAHDGVPLWFRDDSGTKCHGVYFSPQINRHQYDANADVTLTFLETSGSEAV
jgi:hypothetical protein